MVAVTLLLLWIGLALPSQAEQCYCKVTAEICLCSIDVPEASCTAICVVDVFEQLTIGVTHLSISSPSVQRFLVSRIAATARAPKKIEANRDDDDHPPPPLFFNESLCFLPPPGA